MLVFRDVNLSQINVKALFNKTITRILKDKIF